MQVEVRLFARLREGRFKKENLNFPQNCSVQDILSHLKIAEKSVGILLVNGRTESVEFRLAENDVVSAFPAIGGG